MVTIGILALQGAFVEHAQSLEKLAMADGIDMKTRFVRNQTDLDGIDGLIIPGGESTVMQKVATTGGLIDPLRQLVEAKKLPIFGTCAGLILLADKLNGANSGILGGLDIEVLRNAYGSQIDSFVTGQVKTDDTSSCKAIFIRAPLITSVGEDTTVVARLDEQVVGVQSGKILGLSFHPELTEDLYWHRKFISMIN